MNIYAKYCPNVFVAKCDSEHSKGEIITLTTKYGKEHECIVFNMVFQKDGFYYYSIVRKDGFDAQGYAKNKAERLQSASSRAAEKSNAYWEASHEGKDFLALAEPIKVGHHSERHHQALIERNHNRMNKSVELSKKAESYHDRINYWESRAKDINLSMPDSINYFTFELEKATREHEALKNGEVERGHSFSLSYAKKKVNELAKKVELAGKLWG